MKKSQPVPNNDELIQEFQRKLAAALRRIIKEEEKERENNHQ